MSAALTPSLSPTVPVPGEAGARARTTLAYRREIDGLRALAVLPVILFHGGIAPFTGGFVGVDVFFVISGYLITSIIAAELDAGTFTLTGFYERRARRILPALLLVMAVCVPLAWMFLMPGELRRFGQSMVAASVMVSNVFFALEGGGYFSNHVELQPLLHTWSLAVEEHFYLLFPLFLYGTWRLGRRSIALLVAALAVASLVAAQLLTPHFPLMSFYTLPTRGWEIAVGALLVLAPRATVLVRQPLLAEAGAALGVALIGYAVFAFDWTTRFPGFWTLVPVLGTALLISCATPATWVGKLLASAPLVGLGLISYSAYLWHQPLFAFARQAGFGEPSTGSMLALAALSLVLATLSWRFVERPFRDRSRFTRAQIFRFSVWGSVAFVGIGLAIVLCKGYPERLPAEAVRVLAQATANQSEQADPKCNVIEDHYALLNCVKGAKVAPTVALVGDSHAAMLAHELDAAFAERGTAFVQITKNGCPLAFGFIKGGGDQNCSLFQKAYLERLADPALTTVIVASRWASYVGGKEYDNGEGGIGVDPRDALTVKGVALEAPAAERQAAIRAAYTTSVLRLLAMGKRVILVYPVPEQGWNVPAVKAKSLWFQRTAEHPFAVRVESFRARNAAVVAALDAVGEHPALVRVRPETLLCDTTLAGRCITERDGALLYFDDTHLANAAVRPLLTLVLPHLNP